MLLIPRESLISSRGEASADDAVMAKERAWNDRMVRGCSAVYVEDGQQKKPWLTIPDRHDGPDDYICSSSSTSWTAGDDEVPASSTKLDLLELSH